MARTAFQTSFITIIFLMTLTTLRSICQVFGRMSVSWGLSDVFLVTGWGL